MEEIKNFVQLTQQYATSGQPKSEQFNVIADHGYSHVINLSMPDHPHALADEGAVVSALGMNYVHIPVSFEQPLKAQVTLFCNILEAMGNDKVFIHCIMNFRVSAFMYHYLTKVKNTSDEAARSLMFEYWELDPVWQVLMAWTHEDLNLPDQITSV